ncbi:DUF1178 family protein [Novosphingobium flavum]|uniref:DUF1178 family protein n=1 Tax=Novosphingobium aerophilum TaxID=2839843 RepID=UPI001639BD53|nr:DUF1178 family protein [Novosphingobium aerophilum]MBC2661323.1 DUF1178 family protein [Novosphingobium aerophilum]
MIVFDLACRAAGHRFEGWFSSSDDFDRQQASGLLACPLCGSADVAKAVMAPNVGRKGNQRPEPVRAAAPESLAPAPTPAGALTNTGPALPPEAIAMFRAMAAAQAEALKSSRWVGDRFADQARAMHYGERDHEPIHGQATANEARDLIEEGIAVAPLLVPVIPPDQAN